MPSIVSGPFTRWRPHAAHPLSTVCSIFFGISIQLELVYCVNRRISAGFIFGDAKAHNGHATIYWSGRATVTISMSMQYLLFQCVCYVDFLPVVGRFRHDDGVFFRAAAARLPPLEVGTRKAV